MKITIPKKTRVIPNCTVSDDTYAKVEKLAKEGETTMQKIVRAILEQVIDTIEL